MKIPWGKPHFWGNERSYLNQAFDSTWISGGYFVDELESRFAKLHEYKHAIAVANGTCSIYLSLKALGIGPGDEVILPGFGFMAAINMVLESGATPTLCDIERDTMLMDCDLIEELITSKTKAILPIHSYGNVCDMDKISRLAKKYNLHVLEDVAEAIFSKFKGQYAGSFSTISSYSFQTTKTITTGEGGLVLTNSDHLNTVMRKLRSHGMAGKKKYWHEGVAYNFRLTNLQAAIGLAQFENLQQIVYQRDILYKKFNEFSKDLSVLVPQRYNKEVDPVVWAYPLTISDQSYEYSRDELMTKLEEKGIEVRPGFYTPNQLPAYSSNFLPNSDYIAKNTLTIPFYIGLNDEEIEYIFSTIKSFV